MNNPLNRSMFRQAGMSKQPMGILASSPELMTTAQKAMMNNEPVKAKSGFSANVDGFGIPTNAYRNQNPGLNRAKGSIYTPPSLTMGQSYGSNTSGVANQIGNALFPYLMQDASDTRDKIADYEQERLNKEASKISEKDKKFSQKLQASAGVDASLENPAGDVDTVDGLIFDGEKFNYSEMSQKNKPSVASDFKASYKQAGDVFKIEGYEKEKGVLTNIQESLKKAATNFDKSLDLRNRKDYNPNLPNRKTENVDFENKSLWSNLKLVAKKAFTPVIRSLEAGVANAELLQAEKRGDENYEIGFSAEDMGAITNVEEYKALLEKEKKSREPFLEKNEASTEANVIKPNKKVIAKPNETKEKKKSFTEMQNIILDVDRKSEEGYKDGKRTPEGKELAQHRDFLAGVSIGTPDNENNATFKSNLGEMIGIKTNNMDLKEKHKMYADILKGITGDSTNIKTDANFNLIMTGLLIAAGESPNGITNIAKGMAQGLKMYGDSLGEERKDKKEIGIAAFKIAVTADEAEKSRAFQKDEKRKDRVTSTLNKLIGEAGKDANKFGQVLTTTVASNIQDYMSGADYAIFRGSSSSDKAKIIQAKVMQLYNGSPFKNSPVNFDIAGILNSAGKGEIPSSLTTGTKKSNTSTLDNLNKNFSEYSIKKIG